MRRLFCLVWIGILGCSAAPTVKVNSVPEGASVTARASDGSMRTLGKTPLQVSSSELGGGRLHGLTVAKEGYVDHQVFLARDRGSENYDILVRLQGEVEDPKVADSRERQEKLAKNMVQAHNLINNKRLDEARSLLSNVVQEYPHISVGYDLLGNIAYLQKDLKAALGFYERSLGLNPENQETRNMVQRLKGMLQ